MLVVGSVGGWALLGGDTSVESSARASALFGCRRRITFKSDKAMISTVIYLEPESRTFGSFFGAVQHLTGFSTTPITLRAFMLTYCRSASSFCCAPTKRREQ